MKQIMTASLASPVVHLELHTGDLARACALYTKLCGWRAKQIEMVNGSYFALQLGNNLGGGIVECGTRRAVWLPYVEVARIETATDRP
jgi:predicted enzyme related to lactoylglutathione lyase